MRNIIIINLFSGSQVQGFKDGTVDFAPLVKADLTFVVLVAGVLFASMSSDWLMGAQTLLKSGSIVSPPVPPCLKASS